MRSLSAAVIAALAAREVALATLLKMDFQSGTIALNSSNYTLSWNGVDYLAAAGLGRVDAVQENPSEIAGVSLQLLRVDANYIALALDDADQVQGAPITLATAVLDADTHQVLDVVTDWVGYGDTMSISEDGQTAAISLTAESKAVDLLRGTPMFYNDADQQALVPGDRYFEYVTSQADQPVVWPSQEWFYK